MVRTRSDKTAQDLQHIVYEALKVLRDQSAKISGCSERSRPKDVAEITIKVANSY